MRNRERFTHQVDTVKQDVLAEAQRVNAEAAQQLGTKGLPSEPPPPSQDPWREAVARFVEGDVSGALVLAKKCAPQEPSCGSVLRDMREFSTLYKRLEDLDAKGLSRLLTLDKQITGEHGPSHMARKAGTHAANIFYRSASEANAAGQWARAVELARRTLEGNPQHEGAAQLLQDMRRKAMDLFLADRFGRDPDPEEAIPRFREIMALTPPEDELHQKAKRWLEQLAR